MLVARRWECPIEIIRCLDFRTLSAVRNSRQTVSGASPGAGLILELIHDPLEVLTALRRLVQPLVRLTQLKQRLREERTVGESRERIAVVDLNRRGNIAVDDVLLTRFLEDVLCCRSLRQKSIVPTQKSNRIPVIGRRGCTRPSRFLTLPPNLRER